MSENISLFIVDDHPFFRQGVRFFLENNDSIDWMGEAENGQNAIDFLESTPVDLVLMDLQMPGMDGIETTRRLKEKQPEIKILILTSFNQGNRVLAAMKAGASGYILKDANPAELLVAIKAIKTGGSYLGTLVTDELLSRIDSSPKEGPSTPIGMDHLPEPLTDRELEVLQLLGRGHGNKEIADALFISERTVKTHITNIMQKLNVKSRTQAALIAAKAGMV